MKVVILMAGLGSRFTKQASKNPLYQLPKPFIPVRGNPMVFWATSSLPFIQHRNSPSLNTKFIITDKDLIFIALKEHAEKVNIREILDEIYGPKSRLILLPKLTKGNTQTALAAQGLVRPTEELLILVSDDFYNGAALYQAICDKQTNQVGMFPVFTPHNKDPRWCFVYHGKNGQVSKLAEKDPQAVLDGASAMIGTFYFKKASTFFIQAEQMIANNDLTGPTGRQELYIPQIYNRLIQAGHHITAVPVTDMWGLGTPDDLNFFLKHFPNKTPSFSSPAPSRI